MEHCYFEDAEPGYVTMAYEHVVTEQAIIDFASMWDPLPFHVDKSAALKSPYKGLTASGAHVYAIFIRLAHKQDRKMAVIAALGLDNLTFSLPVRPGDTLHLKGECLSARASSSKPDRGIATFKFSLINQSDETVLTLVQPLLLAKRCSELDVFSLA